MFNVPKEETRLVCVTINGKKKYNGTMDIRESKTSDTRFHTQRDKNHESGDRKLKG